MQKGSYDPLSYPKNHIPLFSALLCKLIKLEVMVVALLLPPQYCDAQSTPITLDVIDELNFGTISSENGTCKIKGNGTLVASGGQTCIGSGVPAKFKIRGEPNTAVVASVAQGVSVNGVTYAPSISGSAAKVLNSKGKKNLKIIGKLLLNNALGGQLDLLYTVTVNYQ